VEEIKIQDLTMVVYDAYRKGNEMFLNCLCGRTHIHGFGKDMLKGSVTHRVAHCHSEGPVNRYGYFIRYAGDIPEKLSSKKAIGKYIRSLVSGYHKTTAKNPVQFYVQSVMDVKPKD
jgi:hypothetical protein